MAPAHPMPVAAPEQHQQVVAAAAAAMIAGMSLAGQQRGTTWSGAPYPPSVYGLPPESISGDAMAQQVGINTHPMLGYNCAANPYGQPSAPSPVLPPPPPPRLQPAAQGPVMYSVGIGEDSTVSLRPGRGANGTPYATVAGNSSARVQAPMLRHTTPPGTQVPQATASTGLRKTHGTPATAEEWCYNGGMGPRIETWLASPSDSCAPQAQPASAGDAARETLAPQHQTRRQTRLAAASNHTASAPAADGGVSQHNRSPGPVLLSGTSPDRGAEPVDAEPAVEQLSSAQGAAGSDTTVTEDGSAVSPGLSPEVAAELFGCNETSVGGESSLMLSSATTDGSHSHSGAASGSQVEGDSTDLTLGSPPLSPACKAASSVPSCTASPAGGRCIDAERSGSEHMQPSPTRSVAVSVDAARSNGADPCEYTESEPGRITARGSPLSSSHEFAAPTPAVAGSFAVRVSTAAPAVVLQVAGRPCAASQPASPAQVAARLAEFEATHGALLDTAPAHRLPFEALASPEGSPEPEGLLEGIAEGLLGGSGEDEDEDPVDGDTGSCAEPAAAYGPAARPKRTAGGDPMDVR